MWTYIPGRGKNKVAQNEKCKKIWGFSKVMTLVFRIPKLWQILKHYAGTFHQA